MPVHSYCLLFCMLKIVSNSFSEMHIKGEVFIETLCSHCLYITFMLSLGEIKDSRLEITFHLEFSRLHLLSFRSHCCYLGKLDAIFIFERLSSGFSLFRNLE